MTADASAYFRCQDLLCRFWSALDNRRLDEVMSYLAAGARWQRERWYEGEAEIRGALEARPADMTIRHVLTNLIIDEEGAGFNARLLMVPQLAMAKQNESLPLPADPLATVADLSVKIAPDGEKLKIFEISFGAIFRPKPA